MPGRDELAVTKRKIAGNQFVKGCFLAGIFPVAQSLADFFSVVVYNPAAFFVDEFLIAEGDGKIVGEVIVHYRFIHGFYV